MIDGVTLQRGPAPAPVIFVETFDDPTLGPTSFLTVTLGGLSQSVGGLEVWRLYVWFYVPGQVIWPDNELPADASFFQANAALLFFNFIGEDITQQFDVDGRIASLTSTPVPVPGALPLLGTCILILSRRLRR